MSRIGRIQEELSRTGIDLLVLREQGDVIYATESEQPISGMLLIPRSGEAKLIVTPLDSVRISPTDEVRVVKLERGERYLQRLLKETPWGLRYAEFDSLDMQDALKLEKELGILVKSGNRIVKEMRLVKDTREIEKIRKAAEISSQTVMEILEGLEEGLSEIEVACSYNSKIVLKGACRLAFETIIAFGEDSADPHFIPSRKKLRSGELVLMDAGADYLNYKSDLTRTIIFRRKLESDKVSEIIEAVEESKKAAENKARSGVKACEIDECSYKILEEYGLGKYFIHGLGHGVGIEIHEQPALLPSNKEELKAGNVITIEPGVYIPGIGGVRIEDTYLVTDSGLVKLAF
ncbi:MAG: M24 family metallopeptidase [Thermoproteota archaeon]